ncbi:hypothetical protein PLESTB_001561300 [Pleodorina starrii]|uniref:Uncharacterized protein n=1 Tax=Pleodorina starrii TaxID=330485 RepID=A0A9W6BXD2_9CHLO|nr:hypothetical protein PLESTB_001561300 [Pleodorina starrii]
MTRRQTSCKVDKEDHETSKSCKRGASSDNDNDAHVAHVDLDQERKERMQRNQQILQEMGLMPVLNSLKSAAAAAVEANRPAPKRKQAHDTTAAGEERVLRRSLRTRGQEPELPALLVPLFGRPEKDRPYDEAAAKPLAAARPRAPAANGGGDAAKFDAHNLHRLRTMSDEAMLKRIHKITNTLKLQSLVQLLREFGRDELAEEAQAALDARLANM